VGDGRLDRLSGERRDTARGQHRCDSKSGLAITIHLSRHSQAGGADTLRPAG
jgi:hypothetical protein